MPPSITVAEGASQTWIMTPALATSLSIPAGNAPVQIWFTRTGSGTSRIIRVTLTASGGITLGTAQVTFTPSDTTPTLQTFTVPITAATLPAGATISLAGDQQHYRQRQS